MPDDVRPEEIARHYLRQATVKARLQGAREMREWLAGERQFLPACGMHRIALDAIRTAILNTGECDDGDLR
jgi:hypothetical protein